MPCTVEVLGGCGAWPEPGRACSGFLVARDGFRVVLDLGYGTLSRLLARLGSATAEGLDAVVATHDHPDHVVDLHGLFRARLYGVDARRRRRLPLLAPAAVVDRIAALEGADRALVAEVFAWAEIPGAEVLGPFRVESCALPHWVPDVGVRLVAPDVAIAYTGDTGPSAALVGLARDADLLICDATDRYQRGGGPRPGEPELDLTAREAGAVARDAGARRLLLTHFWPGNDRARSRAEAAEAFAGEVLVADEGLVVRLP